MSATGAHRIARAFPLVLALVVGLAAGWALNSWSGSGGVTQSERGARLPLTVAARKSEDPSGVLAGNQREMLFAELERGEAEESGRIVQTEDLARSFGPSEFQEAAAQAQRVPLRYRKAYLTALAAH